MARLPQGYVPGVATAAARSVTRESEMSTIDESGAAMADSDINSTHPDGTDRTAVAADDTTAEQASGDDAARGNLDGSTAVSEPRERSLDEAGGNGSFDDASEGTGRTGGPGRTGGTGDPTASDAGDSGQDNGLSE